MVGEDLNTGADDKRHEEEIQKVLHAQPCWEARANGSCGRRSAGVPYEEILHCWQLSQYLRYGHADNDKYKTEWQRPQYVYPMPADSNLRHHANLRWKPVVQENTVVRCADVILDGIVRERNGGDSRHTARFSSSVKWLNAWP